ncbi:MAG: leucine-rich repeat domain-containing protein [Clostridia bacterium]|nr:leucine-rich repeat domain-containing protein [Clostridia bacterium]
MENHTENEELKTPDFKENMEEKNEEKKTPSSKIKKIAAIGLAGVLVLGGVIGLIVALSKKDSTPSEGLAYKLAKDGASYIVTGMGECTDKNVIIPQTYNGLPVTAVGEEFVYTTEAVAASAEESSAESSEEENSQEIAFRAVEGLESVTIPEGVTFIAELAFSYCEDLKKVTLPNSLEEVGINAFYSTPKLQYNDLEGLCYLGNKDNPYLVLAHPESTYEITECVVSDSAKIMLSSAFNYCRNLTSVMLGENLTNIGALAFKECTSLTQIEIGGSVEVIGAEAFKGVSSLTSVTIGDNVKVIEEQAFYACANLSELSLGNGIERIGEYAFTGCNDHIYNVDEENDTYYLGNDHNPYFALVSGSPSIPYCEIHKDTKIVADAALAGFSRLKKLVIGKNLKFVGANAFASCSALANVYYQGNEAAWNLLFVGEGNELMTAAERWYYSETQPTTDGKFWRFEDGLAVAW